jgi:HlyD family secretion protein
VTRGDVRRIVTATGALEAVSTVTVGTQVSGVVAWLGADFNSVVREGDVIARLDPSILEAQVAQARANLTRVSTDVRQRKVNLADREAKFERAKQLSARDLLSQSDLDTARLAFEVARMDVESAGAQLGQAEASLNQALVNLSHATIRAPIDGVVTQRSVDVGQTVAASLSSPTLFVIVGDLTKMRVAAGVDESDISRVEPGQPVDVSVDAHPGERFAGTVEQVRLQPTVVSNVTTYTVIVTVGNDERKLMPGMTAGVEIETDVRRDVVRVPIAALRFRPTPAVLAAVNGDGETGGGETLASDRPADRPVRASTRSADDAPARGTPGEVWLHEHGRLSAVQVRLGLADGTSTELLEGDVEVGTAVVIGVLLPDETSTSPANQRNSSVFGGGGGRWGRW